MKYILLFLFLCSSTSYADTFFKYGVGIGESAIKSKAETKFFTLGQNHPINNYLIYQYEAGLWADQGGYPRKTSGFVDLSAGVQITPGYAVIQTLWGLAAITSPDAYLGGAFPQFNQDLYIGLRDQTGAQIGFDYKHISSAGLCLPNKGRDAVLTKVGIPW